MPNTEDFCNRHKLTCCGPTSGRELGERWGARALADWRRKAVTTYIVKRIVYDVCDSVQNQIDNTVVCVGGGGS